MKAFSAFVTRRGRRATAAFSLIEIMVTVGLLSFIILGLVAVFSQTQRAFTSSMAQKDVLESGRAVMEMLSRELSEMAPSHSPATVNFMKAVNRDGFADLLQQDLPGGNHNRTNIVERFFFLSRMNQDWTGRGYEVVPLFPNAGVGSLYRFTETVKRQNLPGLSPAFQRAITEDRMTNRLAEGIVHLRVIPIAANGYPMTAGTWTTNALYRTNAFQTSYRQVPNTFSQLSFGGGVPDLVDVEFISNAVPAFVDLELGILEPQAIERLKSFGTANPAIQRQYLSNRVGQVHIFRQRIPVRNVDLTVYQ